MHCIASTVCAFLAFTVAGHAAPAERSGSKPNVILIYSDDHGWADLGAQGVDKDIRTPNLDQLARDGVRFTRGYVSAPQCVPSRAGVLTGRYQQRFGVEDNQKGPLPLEELTIAERLKPAGYVSCQVGKWHLDRGGRAGKGKAGKSKGDVEAETGGPADPYLPRGQGFDEYFCGAMRTYVASHDLKGNKLPNAPALISDTRFRIVVQTEAALSFIDRHPRDPFFLYLAYFAPHVPLESPEPWFSKTPAAAPLERRQALAMIAAMDEGVGLIRQKLRAHGLEKNTLIVFIGDNGAPLKEGAWDGSLNLPLIGEKGMLTDGGLRTPFVAAWPGTLPAGKVYEPAVIALDVAATAIAMAGLPHDPALDGVNLIPYFTGEKTGAPHELLYWRWRSQASVLQGPWKLIHLGPEQRYLFDTTAPEGETNNVIQAHPDIAARLESSLQAWTTTLKPPGLPQDLNAQDEMFFDAHVNKTLNHATKRPKRKDQAAETSAASAAPGTVAGWVGRGCKLAVQGTALAITPESTEGKGGSPFIAQPKLDVAGPMEVRLRLRCLSGGQGGIAWRLSDQKDFVSAQIVHFEVPAGQEWQALRVQVPARGKIIHVRLLLPKGQAMELTEIQLFSSAGGENASAKPAHEWRFGRDAK
jgi:uncharacterized sulfatase